MFPNLGPMELMIVMGIAVLLFGKRLPEVGRSLGKGIVEFKKGLNGVADDLDFNGVEPTQTCVDDAFASWQREIGKAEEWLAGVPESDLGRELPIAGHPDDVVSIRDLVVHMIEE